MRLYTQEEKLKRTRREINRLKRLFKDMPDDRKAAAEGLIQEAAFMRATLEEARRIIDQDGVLELFEQGEQKFMREHPAVKVYNAMINRYSTISKRLIDLLPDGGQQKAEDELMAFIKAKR